MFFFFYNKFLTLFVEGLQHQIYNKLYEQKQERIWLKCQIRSYFLKLYSPYIRIIYKIEVPDILFNLIDISSSISRGNEMVIEHVLSNSCAVIVITSRGAN